MHPTPNRVARGLLFAAAAASFLAAGPCFAFASHSGIRDFTGHWAGLAALAIFALAYLLAVGEEPLRLRKSKPVIVASGLIWVLVAYTYVSYGDLQTAEEVFRTGLEYYTELFLFLLASMTYINAMSERGVFERLRSWLASRGVSLRGLFWLTGLLTFAISPLADNLTTALLMATVVVAVGGTERRFVLVACINVVVAANSGGAFSPFGDVTTLIVWQRGLVDFHQFFLLFLPSLVSWLIPALFLSRVVPDRVPERREEGAELREGAWVMLGLFIVTIVWAVAMESLLKLPAVIGMMTGLGVLKLYGYRLKRRGMHRSLGAAAVPAAQPFDIFRSLQRAEWDTLMFLYGILMCVAGLAAMGYLVLASELMYGTLGATAANVLVGVLSAVFENIPVMFTVVGMRPAMSDGQWLLVTLTTGVGGSLLSIGSAAGIAVMGQARGVYTFFGHLKWTWAIALGYVVGIWAHLVLNGSSFR